MEFIPKTLFRIDKEARELVLELADGDIGKVDVWLGKEVVEFWGWVWQMQERNKRRLSSIKKVKGKTDDGSKT